MTDARRPDGTPTLESLASREPRSRLLAWLAAKLGDVALAEDGLAEAFARAVPIWRTDPPTNPEGWLLSVAWRAAIDTTRRAKTRARTQDELTVIAPAFDDPIELDEPLVDKRLELMFMCAHPAIDPGVRVPLMLQTVAGVEAARIAPLYLVAPATLAQRLVRAKRRIADAGIPFERPPPNEIAARADSVLDGIYAAFALGRHDVGDGDPTGGALIDEALWLSRLMLDRLPDHAEAVGLRALLLFIAARRNVAEASGAEYVPLHEQDTANWNAEAMDAADALLHRAAAMGRPGRFQIEAAIQSAHGARRRTGRVEHAGIERLYDALLRVAPSVGAAVAQAAAIARGGDADRAWGRIEAIADAHEARLGTHAPYWATRAFAAANSGHIEAALDAYARAIALTTDPAVRVFLERRRDALTS